MALYLQRDVELNQFDKQYANYEAQVPIPQTEEQMEQQDSSRIFQDAKIEKFNADNAQTFANLYVLCVQFFQELGLFHPEAELVIYYKTQRFAASFKDLITFNANGEMESSITGNVASSTEGNEQIRLRVLEAFKKVQKQEDLKTTTYKDRRLINKRIINDKNYYINTVKYEMFGSTELPSTVKNFNLGNLVEAFEVHYLNNIKSITNPKNKKHDVGKKVDDSSYSHYASTLYNFFNTLKSAFGQTAFYYAPDQGPSQVKTVDGTQRIQAIKNAVALINQIYAVPTSVDAKELVQRFYDKQTQDNANAFGTFLSQATKELCENIKDLGKKL